MGDVFMGLAVFFCALWAVAAFNRYHEAIENASLRAEKEKQQRKWEAEYPQSQESMLRQSKSA
jgi:hypothetical protein